METGRIRSDKVAEYAVVLIVGLAFGSTVLASVLALRWILPESIALLSAPLGLAVGAAFTITLINTLEDD